MRQTKNTGRDQQGSKAAEPALEQVLHPSTEENLFGERDSDKAENPRRRDQPGMADAAVQVEKTERESKRDGKGCVEEKFAESDANVPPAQAEVETDPAELADGQEAIQAGVEQGEFPQESKAMRPGRLEPAEIDGEAEREEDQVVEKMAVLFGVALRRKPEQGRDEHGYEEIDQQPAQGKGAGRKADEKPGEYQDQGQSKASAYRQGLSGADAALPAEPKGENGRQQKDQGHDRWDERKGKRHDPIVTGTRRSADGAD